MTTSTTTARHPARIQPTPAPTTPPTPPLTPAQAWRVYRALTPAYLADSMRAALAGGGHFWEVFAARRHAEAAANPGLHFPALAVRRVRIAHIERDTGVAGGTVGGLSVVLRATFAAGCRATGAAQSTVRVVMRTADAADPMAATYTTTADVLRFRADLARWRDVVAMWLDSETEPPANVTWSDAPAPTGKRGAARLTQQMIDDAQPVTHGERTLCDGNGLYLRIQSGGAKSWIFRYYRNHKAQTLGMGRVHDMALAQARAVVKIYRACVRAGGDPAAIYKARTPATITQ